MSRKCLLVIAAVLISGPALTASNAFASKGMPVTRPQVSTFKVGSQIPLPPPPPKSHGRPACYARVC